MAKAIRWTIFVVLASLLLLDAVCAFPQSISPLVSEARAGRKTSGEFTVANNTLLPETVVVEAKSFSYDATGKLTVRPLDPGIDLKLDSMSARLGVKQQHVFGWTATCQSFPCGAALYSSFAAGHANDAVAVILWLATTVYICESKAKGLPQHVCRTSST